MGKFQGVYFWFFGNLVFESSFVVFLLNRWLDDVLVEKNIDFLVGLKDN